MPLAPSAAMADLLRRPIVIMIPHHIRPATPQITRIHFIQPITVFPRSSRPGGAIGPGVGGYVAATSRTASMVEGSTVGSCSEEDRTRSDAVS